MTAFTAVVYADECQYWIAKVDPGVKEIEANFDENDEQQILVGIACLLKLEGNKKAGVRYGSKSYVSQSVPKASVEINALYQISELFYGNDDFANAVALLGVPAKLYGEYDNLLFNAEDDVKKAFISYRKWFEKIKESGLEEARKKKLDPLEGSGVRWY